MPREFVHVHVLEIREEAREQSSLLLSLDIWWGIFKFACMRVFP